MLSRQCSGVWLFLVLHAAPQLTEGASIVQRPKAYRVWELKVGTSSSGEDWHSALQNQDTRVLPVPRLRSNVDTLKSRSEREVWCKGVLLSPSCASIREPAFSNKVVTCPNASIPACSLHIHDKSMRPPHGHSLRRDAVESAESHPLAPDMPPNASCGTLAKALMLLAMQILRLRLQQQRGCCQVAALKSSCRGGREGRWQTSSEPSPRSAAGLDPYHRLTSCRCNSTLIEKQTAVAARELLASA